MSAKKSKPVQAGRKLPASLPQGTQIAALCYRRRKNGKLQILLITSRGTQRWIPPKGWPIKGQSPAKSAATEAFEEAGVKGKITGKQLGHYKYVLHLSTGAARSAYIFPLLVRKLSRRFPEAGQRQLKWFSPKKAARLVREPQLKKILKTFDPLED